jgi:hypothetical protein
VMVMVKVSFVDVVIATPSGAWTPLTSNDSGESAVAGATSHIAGARSHRACTHGENQRRFSPRFHVRRTGPGRRPNAQAGQDVTARSSACRATTRCGFKQKPE